MAKVLLVFLCIASAYVQASSDNVRNDAIRFMQGMNPADVIPRFTNNPTETQFKPTEAHDGDSTLVNEGRLRARSDEAAHFVVQQNSTRARITSNPKASEIEYAEKLLENADAATQSACYMEPVPCEERAIEKTCEESVNYTPVTCGDRLNVILNAFTHPNIKRRTTNYSPNAKTKWIIDLTSCAKSTLGGMFCSTEQELTLHANCEAIRVQVTFNGQGLDLIKTPTCNDPTLIVNYQGAVGLPPVILHVTEFLHDDQWMHTDCARVSNTAQAQHCVTTSANACLEENATKIISNIPVTRRCWGEEQTYQCADGMTSSCAPLMEQGCSNTTSICTHFTDKHCDATSKTFQCTEKICFPDKEVCPEVVGCANGACDTTVPSESDDINEGLSRLGTLSGTAEDAALHQTHQGQASIFEGEAQACEKYPLSLRDCCTDSGFLDGLIHCPSELQTLQRAKLEHRVVSLGHYKHHILGTTHHVYCVYPTKLAGIVQIQGRGAQLQIPFGSPEKPDCSGVTPEQLERIDFKKLDISPLVADIAGRKTLPSDIAVNGANVQHVETLHEKGLPHD